MRKPRVITNCVANAYALDDERIVEFSDSRGNGGLISLSTNNKGKLIVDLYRLDADVIVRVAKRGGRERGSRLRRA